MPPEKRKYNQWSQEDMKHAISAFKEGQHGFNECCRRYNIPKPTFRRHLKCLNKKANNDAKNHGRLTTFSTEMEMELAQHILKLEARLFGLTISDIRRLAFQLASRNQIPNTFNAEKGMAGKAWYYNFMARHPYLSLRQPEKVSLARAAGFNKKNVYEFFDILERTVDEHGFTAMTIYNVDESGFSTVQKRNQKIVAKKGKHQVGGVASGERGINTTIVCCVNAAGSCVPPMIIFKRKRMANELKIGAPPGAIVTISDTGYINTDLFVQWLQHFINHVKCSKENKVLLLLDGHTTHSKNLEALLLARENGIVLLQLPGHTTHRLQPLDVSFFKPMEAYFTQALEKWLRTNPGSTLSQYNMTTLLDDAYSRAANIQTISNGFRATGIWPVDRYVFSDVDFVAAEGLLDAVDHHEVASDSGEDAHCNDITEEAQIDYRDVVRPEVGNDVDVSNEPTADTEPHNVSVQEILPLPELRTEAKKRKLSQPAVILSSTPYKNELEAHQEKRQQRAVKVKRNLGKPEKSTAPIGTQKKFPKATTSKTPLGDVTLVENVDIVINPDEWFCFICEGKEVEDMVKCKKCGRWAHEVCSGVRKGAKKYICVYCQ